MFLFFESFYNFFWDKRKSHKDMLVEDGGKGKTVQEMGLEELVEADGGAWSVGGTAEELCPSWRVISKCGADHPSLTRTLSENCESNYISEVDNRFAVLEKEKNADNTFKMRNISKGTLYT